MIARTNLTMKAVLMIDDRLQNNHIIKSLVSTKKSYEDFEIVDIQFVVSKFGTQRFDFIFAVCIRLFEKFSQSKKSLYSATY